MSSSCLLKCGLIVIVMFVVACTSAYAVTTKIVFSRTDGATYNIVKADANGDNEETILDDDYDNREPAWCGQKIVYSSNKEAGGDFDIWIMDADGTNRTNLTGSAHDGDDSQPDCNAPIASPPVVVFASDEKHANGDIFTISSTGGSITQLTDNEDNTLDPAWCGNSKIVYVQHVGNTPDECGNHIFIMDSDGSDKLQQTCEAAEHVQRAPDCNADGTKIAFTFSDDISPVEECDPGQPDIYVLVVCDDEAPDCCFDLNSDTRLTENAAFDNAASWSPGDATVFFVSDREESTSDLDIYETDSDGSGTPAQVIGNTVSDFHPNLTEVRE